MHYRWLADLRLPGRANRRDYFSGIDSPDHCLDKHHFRQYPHKVDYQYNSRGFRDDEWPEDLESLREAIWCLGDSFTVGLGQPYDHIWPQVLARASGKRTINVSMDGASNNWIARHARQISECITPKHMVIMWSYLHRRELPDIRLTDEHRRSFHAPGKDLTITSDFENFAACKLMISGAKGQILQAAIPNHKTDPQDIWDGIKGRDWPQRAPQTQEQFYSLPKAILQEIQHQHRVLEPLQCHYEYLDLFSDVHLIPYLDRARDGHHFDILTSRYVVDLVLPLVT